MYPTSTDDERFFRSLRESVDAGVFDDRLGRSCVAALLGGYSSAFDLEVIAGRERQRRIRSALGRDEPFNLPRLGQTGLILGKDSKERWCRQPIESLTGHWAVAGGTGAGKSSLFFFWLIQILTYQSALIVFDSYKREFRRLLRVARKLGLELIVLRAGDEKWNILDPDGCDPRGYLPIVVGLLSRVLGLPPLARTLLQRAVHGTYERFGAWNAAKAAPCLYDVYEFIRDEMTRDNHAARETLLARLASLLLALGPVAAYRRGWRRSELEQFRIVVELQQASPMDRELRIVHALLHSMHRRNELGGAFQPLNLVIDDAQQFLTGSESEGTGLTPLAESLGLVRSSGLNVWALYQSFFGVDPGILANLSNKVIGRLGSAHDWSRASAELFLSPEQELWARRNLEPGVHLVQLAQGWRQPFVIRTDRLSMPPPPDDREVVSSQQPLASIPVVEATEYRNWSPVPRIRVEEAAGCAAGGATSSTARSAPTLDESCLRLLAAIVDHPGKPSSDYTELASISARRARTNREHLVREGFIREAQVQIRSRGRPTILLEATELGRAEVQRWRNAGGAT